MKRDIAYDLAEYASSIQFEDLPASTVEATRKDIFDSLSTGIAGSSAKGVAEWMELAEEWGGAPQARLFVYGKRFPAHVTAAINTVMIHGYDYDDTHEVAMMHCGAIVVSSALAAAEMLGGVSGKELITAITVGLDIHCRIGLAATIGIVESGYVYTPLLGVFGAVAAAGRIMKLDKEQMLNALGIAYAQCSGNYQAVTDSAWTKRMQPGFASQAAIVACEMARKGVVGAHNIFEGKYGFYHVYLHDRYNPGPLREGLGKTFVSEDIAFKPWPCGRPNQPPINVALEAREKFGLDPDRVKRVDIYMNEHLYIAGCIPEDVRKKPGTIVEAQFSIPYNVACALVNGKVGLSDYTEENIRRPDVLTMAAKVYGNVDAEIEKAWHGKTSPVYIRIELNNGEILEHHLEYTLGCKEKPMTEKAIADKMDSCIEFSALKMPSDTAQKIRSLVDNLETLENSNVLVDAMLA